MSTKIQELSDNIECISKKRIFFSKFCLGCTIAYLVPALVCTIAFPAITVLCLTLAYACVISPAIIADNCLKCKLCDLKYKLRLEQRKNAIIEKEAECYADITKTESAQCIQPEEEQTPRYSRTKVLHGYIQRRNKALEEDSQK